MNEEYKEEELLEMLFGMNAEDGYFLVTEQGYEVRVTRNGTTNNIITHDLHLNRFNFEIDNGRITSVYWG